MVQGSMKAHMAYYHRVPTTSLPASHAPPPARSHGTPPSAGAASSGGVPQASPVASSEPPARENRPQATVDAPAEQLADQVSQMRANFGLKVTSGHPVTKTEPAASGGGRLTGTSTKGEPDVVQSRPAATASAAAAAKRPRTGHGGPSQPPAKAVRGHEARKAEVAKVEVEEREEGEVTDDD